MKLTRKKLRQLIIETMISPNNLADQILQDPQVNSKIKTNLQTALENNDQATVNSMLMLVSSLYPEYTAEIDMTNSETMMPEYHKEFEKTQSLHKRKASKRLLMSLIYNLKASVPDLTFKEYKPSDVHLGGAIYVYTSDISQLNTLKNKVNEMGLYSYINDYYVKNVFEYQEDRAGKYELAIKF